MREILSISKNLNGITTEIILIDVILHNKNALKKTQVTAQTHS